MQTTLKDKPDQLFLVIDLSGDVHRTDRDIRIDLWGDVHRMDSGIGIDLRGDANRTGHDIGIIKDEEMAPEGWDPPMRCIG